MTFDLGEIIGFVSDACVIAGIVFLALELRQNNRLLQAQARYSLRQYRSDVIDTIMAPHVLEAVHKYAAGENVTPVERSAALMNGLKCIEIWEWQHGEYTAGMLPREHLPIEAWRAWFRGQGPSPVPIREVWEMRKDVMNPDFVQFFEREIVRAAEKQPEVFNS